MVYKQEHFGFPDSAHKAPSDVFLTCPHLFPEAAIGRWQELRLKITSAKMKG